MQIRSLGYRTDLIFPRYEGLITERGDYLVVRTPSNPSFHWGNFLLFQDPPEADALPRWLHLFEEEIASKQPTRHMVFGWDSPRGELGEVEPFLQRGFRLNESIVLVAEAVHPPPRHHAKVTLRPLTTDADWTQALENQIACRPEGFSREGYSAYMLRQMQRYRSMAEAGRGAWFGAFLNDRLVADLGVFVEGSAARFQQVGTHPQFRRQGICGTMVFEISREVLARWGAERLVMVADEHYHAARIYESVGFRPAERQVGIELCPEV
jgi:GNAT superfamily N-acetyltransferase